MFFFQGTKAPLNCGWMSQHSPQGGIAHQGNHWGISQTGSPWPILLSLAFFHGPPSALLFLVPVHLLLSLLECSQEQDSPIWRQEFIYVSLPWHLSESSLPLQFTNFLIQSSTQIRGAPQTQKPRLVWSLDFGFSARPDFRLPDICK